MTGKFQLNSHLCSQASTCWHPSGDLHIGDNETSHGLCLPLVMMAIVIYIYVRCQLQQRWPSQLQTHTNSQWLDAGQADGDAPHASHIVRFEAYASKRTHDIESSPVGPQSCACCWWRSVCFLFLRPASGRRAPFHCILVTPSSSEHHHPLPAICQRERKRWGWLIHKMTLWHHMWEKDREREYVGANGHVWDILSGCIHQLNSWSKLFVECLFIYSD